MWQNPINFLFFLGILFWVPQLESQKSELEADQSTLSFLLSHPPQKAAAQPKAGPTSGPVQISGSTRAAVAEESCLYQRLEIASDRAHLNSGDLIYSASRLASQFLIEAPQGTVRIESPELRVVVAPNASELVTTSSSRFDSKVWSEQWGIRDPAVLHLIASSQDSDHFRVQCLKHGASVTVTGYLRAEQKMAFTVSTPFTISFIDQSNTISFLYEQVSRSYLGCAFIILMMGTLGLAILSNTVLRARVNLTFETIDPTSAPWNTARSESELAPDYWLARVGIKSHDVQFKGFASLPSFYRYNWDDGLTLAGRKVYIIAHVRGLTLIEMCHDEHPRSVAHIMWADLLCVYFTHWRSKQSWFDLVTREGERYQITIENAEALKTLLKKWDASEMIQRSTAA